MRNHVYATLWKVTGLIACGLLIATIILAYQARHLPQSRINAVLTGHNPTMYLRAEPSGNSKIVTILERGSDVHVIDTITNQNTIWVKVDTGYFTGWLPEANIVFEGE